MEQEPTGETRPDVASWSPWMAQKEVGQSLEADRVGCPLGLHHSYNAHEPTESTHR